MKATEKVAKTSSLQGTSNIFPNRGIVMPKDLFFDSNATFAKIHTTRSSASLNKYGLEGIIV